MNQQPMTDLHDRATRGEKLTAEERERLGHWYELQDQQEAALLSASATQQPAAASLQSEIDAALAQLSDVTQRIRTLSEENDALRREIASSSTSRASSPSSRRAGPSGIF